MEILKDGAAAAIYGSVAANGVVIVSTKNGKEGELKVSFNTYMTVNSVAKKFDMLNADGYLKVHNMMYENAGTNKPAYLTYKNGQNPTGADTNWQDEMLRTGIAQNYYVNLIGGSEVAKYSLSYGHADEKGIFKGNSYIQDNARLKLNAHKYIFDFDAELELQGHTKQTAPVFLERNVLHFATGARLRRKPDIRIRSDRHVGRRYQDGIPNQP